MSLRMKQAFTLVEQAIAAAERQSVSVAVVVVDLGGHVVASARMDGVGFVNTQVATAKAAASANFGIATHAVAAFAAGDPMLAAALHANSLVSILPGGVPVLAEGTCVGALGVAGSHYTQDQIIAEEALGGSQQE